MSNRNSVGNSTGCPPSRLMITSADTSRNAKCKWGYRGGRKHFGFLLFGKWPDGIYFFVLFVYGKGCMQFKKLLLNAEEDLPISPKYTYNIKESPKCKKRTAKMYFVQQPQKNKKGHKAVTDTRHPSYWVIACSKQCGQTSILLVTCPKEIIYCFIFWFNLPSGDYYLCRAEVAFLNCQSLISSTDE